MSRRKSRGLGAQWCSVHHTREIKLYSTCPYCTYVVHLHEANIKVAKRGVAQVVHCSRCKRKARVMPSVDGKRWELVVQEDGQPVIQMGLGLKVHQGVRNG